MYFNGSSALKIAFLENFIRIGHQGAEHLALQANSNPHPHVKIGLMLMSNLRLGRFLYKDDEQEIRILFHI